MEFSKTYDVVIIGAGLAGISAGNYLKKSSMSVKILDKGKAVGGRLATKRIKFNNKDILFDYGCRFLVANSSEFRTELGNLMEHNVISNWKVVNQNALMNEIDMENKMIGRKSMREIAIELSRNLEITTKTKIIKIKRINEIWEIYTEQNIIYKSLNLILTMPIPQIHELLENSNIKISKIIAHDLLNVKYLRNIVGLLVVDGNSRINDSGAIKFFGGDISFITDNNLKGINQNFRAITVEMSDDFSRKYWSLGDTEILDTIIDISKEWVGKETIEAYLHRWKYSIPLKPYNKKYEFVDKPGPLYFAGDAFLGNSAESAYLSGLYAAKSLVTNLSMNKTPVEL